MIKPPYDRSFIDVLTTKSLGAGVGSVEMPARQTGSPMSYVLSAVIEAAP